MILSTIVGSRLHGTHNEDSDYDYRGVFLAPIEDILSPFRKTKETHWMEGEHKADVDDTAYELRKFCKMASQGNPSVLEILVGEEYPTLTEEGERLRELLPAFLSRKCYFAFSGYAHNQEKKFRESGKVFESKGSQATDRKWKYACAHVRTLYQLHHLLKKKELIGKYADPVAKELKAIKEGRWRQMDIMDRIFQLEEQCQDMFENTWLPNEPDTEAIESFILSCYA